MRRNIVGKSAIEERSHALGIPMEHILAGYVLEQLALRISESERGTRLLLKNTEALGLSGCSRNCRRLYYAYVLKDAERFAKADFARFLTKAVKWEKDTDISWSFRSEMHGSVLDVAIRAELDGMVMPVELAIEPVASLSDAPATATLRLIMENNKVSEINAYPMQKMLMDDLCEALSKLELIGDMSVYERIYSALGMADIEGRAFQKRLEDGASARGISLDKARHDQMASYMDYPYMEKKWKAYLKRQRKTQPSWEMAYGRFWSFIDPIWIAEIEGLIYLGSWVSELGRYLD